jgi:hypothetical protein
MLSQTQEATKPCAWCGRTDSCPDPEGHHQKRKASVRRAQGKVRRARVALKKCVDCGEDTKHRRCPTCLIKQRRPRKVVSNRVSKQSAWREDGDGWSRYRGMGKRGQPAASITDAADVRYAIQSLTKAGEALAYAHSLSPDQHTKAQRNTAKQAALAQVAHAGRFIDELLERHGFTG